MGLIKKIKILKRAHLSIHPEGMSIIKNLLMYLIIINGLIYFIAINEIIFSIINLASLVIFAMVLYFFRNPERIAVPDESSLYAPADGKVVAIEQTMENEYFNEPRIQVSIFMSPLNVHVNRAPISGDVTYYKYHPGDYLVAWHPKSSTHNERTTVVLKTFKGVEILLRQIAGAVARRIVCYAKDGGSFAQGQDLGFIKFGSRVDILLPLNAEIKVKIGDLVKGNLTVVAKI
jgi:phosphatidylserine decarboxylase